jgi:hypothetical protein
MGNEANRCTIPFCDDEMLWNYYQFSVCVCVCARAHVCVCACVCVCFWGT